ncbi:hypothetical protein [Niallia sp. MER 6]|nr:hypothetical protein [Niallia sp. MER 6]MCM3034256.1 hypothetical protein [Niallia sp. MER 6]
MKEKEKNENITAGCDDDEIIFTMELDLEAFNVILRLYDNTFRDLVDR